MLFFKLSFFSAAYNTTTTGPFHLVTEEGAVEVCFSAYTGFGSDGIRMATIGKGSHLNNLRKVVRNRQQKVINYN